MSFLPQTLSLPFPPSVNTYWRSVNGRAILSKAGREYRGIGLCSLQGQASVIWPLSSRLAVTVTLLPPDKRRRDVDNFGKALLDLLTHGGVYLDDSQIDRLTIIRGPVEKGGRAVVRLEGI